MNKNRGFTLIELLIVVAIIAILAAIAVPNFLEAQTRAKIARVKADIRSVVTALEAYRVDENRYPPCASPTDHFDGSIGLRHVTTPVAYIMGDGIKDIYIGKRDDSASVVKTYPEYSYFSRNHEPDSWATMGQGAPMWYMVVSKGPDLVMNSAELATAIQNDDFVGFVNTCYDPTNGVISAGNIYRSGGDIKGRGASSAYRVTNYDPGTKY